MSSSSSSSFAHPDNLRMIWDLISDEELFRFLSKDMQSKVHTLFTNNIKGFYDSERTRTASLVEMNKKYILLILRYIKTNFAVMPSKIRIHSEEPTEITPLPPPKELITFEEIQHDKQSQFERDFTQRQEEFQGYMQVKVPPAPSFADQDKDQPIREMDKILKEMQAQRNYEIEQIRTFNNAQPNNWLDAQETSIKSPPLSPQKKTVSFEIEPGRKEEDDLPLFSKLKKVVEKDSITLEVKELDDRSRVEAIEKEVQVLNKKLDRILELLGEKK